MEMILLALLGIGICAAGVLDLMGNPLLVRKVYRDMVGLQDWQRVNGGYEIAFGVSLLLFVLIPGSMVMLSLGAGILMMVVCVMMARHNQEGAKMKMEHLRAKKEAAQEEAQERQETEN